MGTVGEPELSWWGRSVDSMNSVSVAGYGGGGGSSAKLEKIVVSVRLRPLNEKEIATNDSCDWECINDTTIIFKNSFPDRSMPAAAYSFDRVFGWDSSTKQVYEEGAKEVALSVVSGINSTIFAYGQTSSGKTFTMSGITEYTVADIYDYINKHEEREFVLKFSAIEIYNEAVRDLLSSDSTPLRLLDDPEKGTTVEKLTEETLRNWSHLKDLISVCEAQRKIGETSLNETSSRSHQILRLTIESSARECMGKDNPSSLVASVNFVDLAGSERASQAMSAGTRLKEGCHINRSLLTLGTVIRKLSKGRNGHVPYRDSKLTRILQSSLGGNARTAIICTVCPARSHTEQSRNTLLFASCAKEVTTNAQVNVVMSDKALVKHLQKELARLETQMRLPDSSQDVDNLLLEKDARIRKMEKQIVELMQQRDLAQTKLQSLLNSIEADNASRQWENSSQSSTPNVRHACDDTLSTSELSDIADLSVTLVSNNFVKSLSQHSLKRENLGMVSPNLSVNGPVGIIGDEVEQENVQSHSEDSEEHCKEVQCIEINGTNINNSGGQETEKHKHEGFRSFRSLTLEQHLRSVRKPSGKEYFDELSPWTEQELSNPRGLLHSRSCRSSSASPSWFKEVEWNDKTPPPRSLTEFPGRPEAHKKRLFALHYDSNVETMSVGGSECSKLSTSTTEQNGKDNEQLTGIHDFVTELKEMAQAQYQSKHVDGQETGERASGTDRDFDLDLASYPPQTPSRWPQEFEKKQKEILELWHACNVSLVHRTYFFMLFKGDPSDSIYMEVEVRRLSFLKNTITRANLDKSAAVGQNTSELSSKMLRREREMLCRQMQKRLSADERDSLYIKWGISVNSKQRRLQLAKHIWSETNLEHVRESASLVARLVGLQEEGQALKEMFGLSFIRQDSRQRFSSWRNGLSSRA